MASAKYTVFIPDTARQVAVAAHHYLTYGPLKTDAATVQYGTPFDMLIVHGEEDPAMDSHIKQIGVFAAELANIQSVTVTKEGKNTATWTLHNPH